MSQSPTTADTPGRDGEYFRNWNALGELIKRGNSFSGRERHCVFLNTGGPQFADVSAVTQLDFIDDGRCVGLTDWDDDGDLDMWLVNRTAPRIRLLRNDFTNSNRHLSLRLVGSTCNRDAIGARVEVVMSDPNPGRLMETVRAGDGFLTQSTKWLHFGVGPRQQISKLRIRWPGASRWEEFPDLATGIRYEIIQGTGVAQPLETAHEIAPLAASPPKIPPASSQQSRVVLTAPVPLTVTDYQDFNGQTKSLLEGSGPVLVTFWASWCQPCLQELRDFAEHREALENAGLRILPLCTDPLEDPTYDVNEAQQVLQQLGIATPAGVATSESVAELTHLLSWVFYRQRPLPLPCSFLLNTEGQLAVVYRGPATVDQILADVRLLTADSEALIASQFPGTGHFLFPHPGISPLLLVRAYREGGYFQDAKRILQETLREAQKSIAPRRLLVDLFRELSIVEAALGNNAEVVNACREAVRIAPEDPALAVSLAVALANQGDRDQAAAQLDRVAQAALEDAEVHRTVGQAWLSMRDPKRAAARFSRALELAPDDAQTRFNLAICLQLQGDGKQAAALFERILARDKSHALAANNLAWIYATNTDQTIRDGTRAVTLAEHACRLTNHQRPVFLGTLSAAYAEAGEFAKAVQTIRTAIELAHGSGEVKLAADLAKRLELHQQKLPYRESRTQNK